MNTTYPHICDIKKGVISFLKERKQFYLHDIIMLEGDSNYTFIHLQSGKKLLMPRTLKMFEILLENHGFLRTHRGFLINCQHLCTLNALKDNLTLTNNLTASISRRRKVAVVRQLKNKSISNN